MQFMQRILCKIHLQVCYENSTPFEFHHHTRWWRWRLYKPDLFSFVKWQKCSPCPPPLPSFMWEGGGDCGHKTACEPARWGPNIQNLHFISILVKFIAATVPSIVPFTSVGRALSGSTWKPKTFKGESVYFHNITYQLHFKTTMLFPERNICPLAPFFMKYFILLYLRVSQWVLCKSRWRFLYDEGQPHY